MCKSCVQVLGAEVSDQKIGAGFEGVRNKPHQARRMVGPGLSVHSAGLRVTSLRLGFRDGIRASLGGR